MYINEPILHHENAYKGNRNPEAGSLVLGGLPAFSGYQNAAFMDDFIHSPASNVPNGWAAAIIDTGSTVVAGGVDGDDAAGVLKFADDDSTASGASVYLAKCVEIGTKEWYLEARVKTADADDTDLQIGLSALNATTNPEDLWTTASTDVIAFGVLDGDATVKSLIDKNNGGTSAVTGTIDLSDDTWHTLGIRGKGAEWVKFYVDGVLSHTDVVVATIPDDLLLAPFIGFRTGGDAAHVGYVDYFRFGISRA